MAGGGPLQQVVERDALVVVERAQHLVLDLGERSLGLAEARGAGVGQRDEVAPAVLGRSRAGDEPVVLELVEQAHEIRAVDLQRGGERLLRHPAVVAQDRQRDEVARAEAERQQRRLGASPVEACEVVEERPRRPGACGVLDGHGPSVGLAHNILVLQLIGATQTSCEGSHQCIFFTSTPASRASAPSAAA